MCHENSKQLYRLSFTLLGKSYEHILPSLNDDIICKTFLTFFTTKINNIIDIIEIELQSSMHSITQSFYKSTQLFTLLI